MDHLEQHPFPALVAEVAEHVERRTTAKVVEAVEQQVLPILALVQAVVARTAPTRKRPASMGCPVLAWQAYCCPLRTVVVVVPWSRTKWRLVAWLIRQRVDRSHRRWNRLCPNLQLTSRPLPGDGEIEDLYRSV